MNVFFARQKLEGNFRNPRSGFKYDALASYCGEGVDVCSGGEDVILGKIKELLPDALLFGDCGQRRFVLQDGAKQINLKNYSAPFDSLFNPLLLLSAVKQKDVRYKDLSNQDNLTDVVKVCCAYFYRSGYIKEKPLFLTDGSPFECSYGKEVYGFAQTVSESPHPSTNISLFIPILSSVKGKKQSAFNAIFCGYAYSNSEGAFGFTFKNEQDAILSFFETVRKDSNNFINLCFNFKFLKSVIAAGCIRSGINIPDHISSFANGSISSAERLFPYLTNHETDFPYWLLYNNAISEPEFGRFFVNSGNGEEQSTLCAKNLSGWAAEYLNTSPTASSFVSGKSVSTKRGI